MHEFADPIYTDEDVAREHLEKLRWANGRFCPHCGETERTSPIGGEKHRSGLYYCNGCKGQFTVMVGSVFERSHIPLTKWVLGFAPDGVEQEGRQRAPASPHARPALQDSLVHGPPHPRGDDRRGERSWRPRRRGQDRRGRRDLFRQQGRARAVAAARRPPVHQGRQERPGEQARGRGLGRAWRQGPHVSRRPRQRRMSSS